MSQPDEAVPEEAPCRPPREAWPLTRAEDELVQWMNRLRRRGVLRLDELVVVRMEWIRSKIRRPLWWSLVLLIEALVLFPNIEREGSQHWRADLKGDSKYQLS